MLGSSPSSARTTLPIWISSPGITRRRCAGVERDVADRAVRADRDERDLADLRVLVVDAGHVDANLARLRATDRERAAVRARCAASRGRSLREERRGARERAVSHVPCVPSALRSPGVHLGPHRAAGDTFDHETRRPMPNDRRRRRSSDPLVALHYQLSSDARARRARCDRRRRRLRGRRRRRRVLAGLRGARRLRAAPRRGRVGIDEPTRSPRASRRCGAMSRFAPSRSAARRSSSAHAASDAATDARPAQRVERDLDEAAARSQPHPRTLPPEHANASR